MANARRRTQRTSRTTSRIASRNAGTGAMAATFDADETRLGKTIDWEHEMKYIKKDLRELMIITVILFVLLFAVGIFL